MSANGDFEEEFRIEGKPCRTDGPSFRLVKGRYSLEEYRRPNGERHRTDGPALIEIGKEGTVSHCYFRGGKLHRTDGPAYIRKFPDGFSIRRYYINGVEQSATQEAPTAPQPKDAEPLPDNAKAASPEEKTVTAPACPYCVILRALHASSM
jgi:hypothetical protein